MRNTRNDQRGFTLMEMLIVVAIIAILIAVAIPTFSSQLEKAREATDQANFRSAYAVAQSCLLTNEGPNGETVESLVSSSDWYEMTPGIGAICFYLMNDGSFQSKTQIGTDTDDMYQIKSDFPKPDFAEDNDFWSYYPSRKGWYIAIELDGNSAGITEVRILPTYLCI